MENLLNESETLLKSFETGIGNLGQISFETTKCNFKVVITLTKKD